MNTMLFTLPSYLGMSSDAEYAALFARFTFWLGPLSFVLGGSYFFVRTWRSLQKRLLHIDLPISLGLVAAYAGSVFAWLRDAHGFIYFDFVSTFTFLMLVGRWLQQKAAERNRAQLLAAQANLPPVRNAASGVKLPSPISHRASVFCSTPVKPFRSARGWNQQMQLSAWNGSAAKVKPPLQGAGGSCRQGQCIADAA